MVDISKTFKTLEPITITTRVDENRVPIICRVDEHSSTYMNGRPGEIIIVIKRRGICFTVVGVKCWNSVGSTVPKICINFKDDIDVDAGVSLLCRERIFDGPDNVGRMEWVPKSVEDCAGAYFINADRSKLCVKGEKIELDSEYDGFVERKPGVRFADYPGVVKEDVLQEI